MARSSKLPKEGAATFQCPHCGVVASQWWADLTGNVWPTPWPKACRCSECDKISLWYRSVMLVPATGGMAPPSPRPAERTCKPITTKRVQWWLIRSGQQPALLRLAIEKLCVELNDKPMRLDDHIAALVAKGLNEKTALMFDVVRVGGNSGAHPIDHIGVSTSRGDRGNLVLASQRDRR